jgi:peroxiredoxin/glutaredoxin
MSFPNHEGDRAPETTLHRIVDGNLTQVSTSELFSGRKVIVFGLPGAFTPTCSSAHVPRFDALAETFGAQGVDEIVCVSVNDAFVMDAWRKDQNADHVSFLADGNGTFTKKLGLLVDKADLGFGPRSWRYSMLVEDGVIAKQFIEPDVPGDPYEVSDADTMLRHIAPKASEPHDILLLTKPGCSHCARAKSALREKGLPFEDVSSNITMLRAVSDTATTPRVFVDGKLIGGADELIAWLD